MERFYSNSNTETSVGIPGLTRPSPHWFNGNLGADLGLADYLRLPSEDQVEGRKTNFWNKESYSPLAYIKLHGSHSWEFNDGTPGLVIGHSKTSLLDKEPLLRWYKTLFERVLRAGDRKLFVIGYGFNDEYINDVIADAIGDKGLKLIILSPKPPQEFEKDLYPVQGTKLPKPRGQEFWPALYKYHEGKLTDFYMVDSQTLTPKGQALKRDLGRN